MPHEITFDTLPMGHAAESVRNATRVRVRTTEFLSTEDGQEFIRRLERMPMEILGMVAAQGRIIPPSQVDHLLAIIRPDRTATVYVNELQQVVETRVARSVEAGQPLFKNDIVDITRFDFDGVNVPPDAGLVLVFSVGWRKAYFYDLTPLHKEGGPRPYDVGSAFGQMYAHVLFQERFSILDTEWEALFKAKWFPFAGLANETIGRMLTHLRAGWPLDDLTHQVAEEVRGKLPAFLDLWRKHPAFANHMPIFERAAERFLAGDHVSCTGLVFPRIEGIMRSNHAAAGATGKLSQENLCSSAVRANADRDRCLLLPHRFHRYLQEVYFASFNPADPRSDVSRNSVGHGVADPADFSEKAAVIGLLVVQQLCYSSEAPSPPEGRGLPIPATELAGSGA
jgi:hypothetical protein